VKLPGSALLDNTRSPEAPAAATDVHICMSHHVRPASASVCMCAAGTGARPPIRVSAVADDDDGDVPMLLTVACLETDFTGKALTLGLVIHRAAAS